MRKKGTGKRAANKILNPLRLMGKLTFVFLISGIMMASANERGPQTMLMLEMKNVTVAEVIQKIESMTDYIFIYSEENVDLNRKVDLISLDDDIESVLKKVFDGTANKYTINDRQIILFRKDNRPINKQTNQQKRPERIVTGTVLDDQNLPLPGVNIILKGTGYGVVTDTEGKYSIRVREGMNEFLRFSFIGMRVHEVAVGDQNEINVVMQPEEQIINDVVVVGAYGKKQSQIDMTGSAFQLNAKDLEALPSGRVDLLLDGIVPGVRIEPNTDAPSSTRTRYNMRVRGEASLSASNEPLWIVDGTPIFTGDRTNMITGVEVSVSPLSYINPEDIESITVLKDASETSIYGADGANGVILITTRQGTKGATRINISGRYGVSMINESTRFKVLNAEEYLTLAKEAYVNAGKDLAYFPFQDNDLNQYSTTNTDWYDVFYGLGQTYQGNLTLSGGNDKSTYYISGGYYREEQTVIGNSQDRFSLRVNDDLNLGKKLTAGFRVSASYNVNNIFNPGTDYYEFLPIYSVYNNDGSFRLYNQYIDGMDAEGNPYWKTAKFFNSVAEREENDHIQKTFASNSNISLKYSVNDDLSVTSQIGVDYQSYFEEQYSARTNWSGMSLSDGEPIGYSSRRHSNFLYWTNIERINYDRTIGKHHMDAMLGFEMRSQKRNSVSASGEGFVNDHIKEIAYAEDQDGSSSSDLDRAMSFFARGGYSYDMRYYLNLIYRRDGNSLFGEDVRWANFWSLAGSWNIHKEDFFDVPFIDILKIKGSYGTNGNSRLGNRQAEGVYSYSESYNYVNNSGVALTMSPNPGLSWETTYMTNLGLRVKFLRRIEIDAEWYNNKTVDLISNVDVSWTTGNTTIYRNVGSIRNRGYEITVNSVNVLTPEIRWSTRLNASHNSNKLLELYNGIEKAMGTKIWREGYGLDTYYLVRWAGVDPRDGSPMWYDAEGNITKNYSYDYRVPYKSSSPDLDGALINTLEYKNFEFQVILNYVIGGYGFSSFGRGTSSDGLNIMSENQSVNQLDRWQEPGDLALSPKPIWGVSTSSTMNSTRYLYEKTHLRLQNISLSYNLPKYLLEKVNLNGCRISFIADNLGLWTPYDHSDRNSYRQSMSGYPMETMYSLNVNFSF
ncbi:SusC/RagA family TonB-linked outer membrane protein [Thermophagus sp. OGC60D27]|uniref:SusC/RagA family TonB-linked outer membrane protein n=1 Tax=Thermophagus sp. OGC60D27 TaxID=3458415 RepID=UPI0040378A3B